MKTLLDDLWDWPLHGDGAAGSIIAYGKVGRGASMFGPCTL